MSGRIEKDNLIENKISKVINNQHSIIKGYSKGFGGKTANTKESYIKRAINFCNFLQKEYNIDFNNQTEIKTLNYMHIIAYMDFIKNHMPDGTKVDKGINGCAVDFYAVKHFCKYLKSCRFIDYNPCDEVEIPKDKKIHDIVSLTQDEIYTIKNNILKGVGSHRAKATQEKWKNRDLCIVFLGITTGLRVSAITNIDIKDIDFNSKTLKTIEKGNYERIIYLSDKMIELINKWIKDREKIFGNINCDALFISAKKQRISTNTIRDMLTKYTYNINKNITPHKLRSTAATNLYDKTGDIYLVADVLGHHNIQNTKRYASVSTQKRELAASMLSNLM